MKYQEILDEYKRLLQVEVKLKQQLQSATKAALDGREVIKQELKINQAEQNRIENAVQIIDEDLARLLWRLKQCGSNGCTTTSKKTTGTILCKSYDCVGRNASTTGNGKRYAAVGRG